MSDRVAPKYTHKRLGTGREKNGPGLQRKTKSLPLKQLCSMNYRSRITLFEGKEVPNGEYEVENKHSAETRPNPLDFQDNTFM